VEMGRKSRSTEVTSQVIVIAPMYSGIVVDKVHRLHDSHSRNDVYERTSTMSESAVPGAVEASRPSGKNRLVGRRIARIDLVQT
jgi:hypothetical protein